MDECSPFCAYDTRDMPFPSVPCRKIQPQALDLPVIATCWRYSWLSWWEKEREVDRGTCAVGDEGGKLNAFVSVISTL